MQHMEKASLYNVDSNRPATAKQLYAVGNHFAKIQANSPSGVFRLSKVFSAILLRFNAEHSATPITHGDVTRFFELDAVPQKFLERISVKAPKKQAKSKTSTKSTKTVAEPSKKVIKAKTAKKTSTKSESETVKASTQSVEDFAARLEALNARFNKVEATVESHDKKLASMDAKLDILMAWLETNPEI